MKGINEGAGRGQVNGEEEWKREKGRNFKAMGVWCTSEGHRSRGINEN